MLPPFSGIEQSGDDLLAGVETREGDALFTLIDRPTRIRDWLPIKA
jgi:hypothetical protein